MKIETRRIIAIYLYLYNIYLYGVRARLYKFYNSIINQFIVCVKDLIETLVK